MLSRVATINTVHPKKYFARPGYGCMYTYVDSVEIGHERVKITILALDCGEISKKIDVIITDSQLLKLLPSLLGGEISCLQATQEAESFLRKKHKDEIASYHSNSFWQRNLQSADPKNKIYSLLNMLLGKESFADLCFWFPHDESERMKLIGDHPIKVVDDKILGSLKQISDPSTLASLTTMNSVYSK